MQVQSGLMANLLSRVEATLRSFYIFNSSYGHKTGEEHNKILYYHPTDIELNTKIRDVGLSEAIIAFTNTFTGKGTDCESIHTEKTMQLFYQPEDGFWIIMVLNVPKEIRHKNAVECENYCNDELNDTLYQCLLEQAYKRFRLLHGTFQMILNGQTANAEESVTDRRINLELTLRRYFDQFISTLKLPLCDLRHFTRSVLYLPLNKSLFLRVHNFINMLKATFPNIADTLLLFKEHLVCGGRFNPILLYTLYDYILDGNIKEQNTANNNVEDESNHVVCKVYLPHQTQQQLTLYNVYSLVSGSATLYIFFKNDEIISMDHLNDIRTYVDAQLMLLSTDLSIYITEENKLTNSSGGGGGSGGGGSSGIGCVGSSDSDNINSKYIFINQQTLKYFSNLPHGRAIVNAGNAGGAGGACGAFDFCQPYASSVRNLLVDISNATTNTDDCNGHRNTVPGFEETVVKSTNDFWLFQRQCNWCQFCTIIFNKKATLLDVTTESETIFEQQIKDDVFFDK